MYVSGSVKTTNPKHTPANMVNNQNTHLHETPATPMKPPTMGPSDGPANGARVKNAKAFPLVLASQISDMMPLVTGV